jgi:type IV pilus assembly protein PilB
LSTLRHRPTISPTAPAPAAEDLLDRLPGLVAPTPSGRSQRSIGDTVVALGFADRGAVEAATAQARQQGKAIGEVLVEAGELGQDQLARALAERHGVHYIDLSAFEIDRRTIGLISFEAARRYQALPVALLPNDVVLVAMADPANVVALDEISMITGMKVRPAVAERNDLVALIGRSRPFAQTSVELEAEEPEPDPAALSDSPYGVDAPIIKLVDSIIALAVERGASDVHLDPEPREMQVLFRVDGVITPAARIARSDAGSVISRIKIMAGLNIAERRAPQDGRIALTIDARRIDVRVVTLPLIHGEGLVMRILDNSKMARGLGLLGMRDADRALFVEAIGRPYGAVLVTGPTGSGKSTTLYGALDIVNNGQRSVLTIEDPVESPILGIKQIQVSPKAGVSFASALRSMLRADPDVIMVGEIRDRETADIAVQAALTGHLVLSTLHTRDAASAMTRLIEMGLEPFMIAAAVDCVVAQRLARTLCDQCKRPARLSDEVLGDHGLAGSEVFEPAGCVRCGGTGYAGRIGLYEVMSVDEGIRELLLERRGVDDLAAAAARQGMRTMRQDGIEKVKQGVTSLVEVARVTTAL